MSDIYNSRIPQVGDEVMVRVESHHYGTIIYWADRHGVIEVKDNIALISDSPKEDDEKYFSLTDLIIVSREGVSRWKCSECKEKFLFYDFKKRAWPYGSFSEKKCCPFCKSEYFEKVVSWKIWF